MSRQIVDLTYPIHEGMTTYPTHWHPIVEVSILGRHGLENRETRKITLGSHTGTHCDAPLHFVPGGKPVDSLPLDTLVGPAFVADLTHCGPLHEVSISDLEKALDGRRPERLVLRYDWSDHWGKMKYYNEYPFLTLDASKWLVDNGVKLLAIDTPSPDDPRHGLNNPPDSPNHTVLLRSEVILVEYLCNLKSLTSPEIELIVLPLKIQGSDGAPVRCIAIEDDEN